MFSNTGTVSFFLYGFFVLLGLTSIFIAYRLIKKSNLEPDKLDKFLDYFKWVIITLAVSTVTLIISDLFKEREQDVKELEYFDKYVNDVKNQENPLARLQLAKYLSIVAPSGDMKISWTNYYDSIQKEYDEYLVAQKIIKNDTLTNQTPEQIKKIEESQQKVELFETPLTSNISEPTEWYIVAGGDANMDEANFELEKAIKINSNSSIVKKGNSYRTVLMGYATKLDAEKQLLTVRTKINPTSYIVRKSTWCTTIEQTEECLICK